MKKTALVLILSIVLFSTVVISQTVRFADANPGWQPWLYPIVEPTITFASPLAGGDYPSNNVWLNFTVTKPLEYFNPATGTTDAINKTNYRFEFVDYSVDDRCDGVEDEKEIRIDVNEPSSVVNVPSSFSFSVNLTGLKDGPHTIDVCVYWIHNDVEFATGINGTIPFYVYTPSPEPTSTTTPTPTPEPTATPGTMSHPDSSPTTLVTASVSVLAVIVGISLFVYFKKRQRDKSP